MKKKILCMMMAFVMIGMCFAGCTKKVEEPSSVKETKKETSANDKKEPVKESNINKEGFPLVKKTETLKVLGLTTESDNSPQDSVLYQELEEKTNVKIEWTLMTESAWKEKKGLLFANNDLPDVIIGNGMLTDQDILNYGSQGLLTPINKLYDEYGYYLKEVFEEHPELKKMITAADGNMYTFPQFDRGFLITTASPMYINKEWLDAVGMDVPTTTDELYKVLKAFKEQDPNKNGKQDEIPYSFSKKMFDLFGAFGIVEDNDKTHLTVKGGKVVYTMAAPEYKEGVKYFNKLFSEGLIDEEAFTQDGGLLNGKIKGETRAIGLLQSWRSTGWKRVPEDNDYVPVPPLAGPDGTRMWPLMQSGGSRSVAAITNTCKNPEVAMRWIDALYEPEWSVQLSLQYYIGEHMVKEGDKFKIIRKPSRDDSEDIKYFSNTRIFNVRNSTGARFLSRPAHIIEKQELDQIYNNFYPEEYYPSTAFLSIAESEELTEIAVDINSFAEEMNAKWMMSGGIEEEWDDYIEQLNDMGLQRYLEIYQGALERYNK